MPALGPDRKPVLNADGTPKIAKMPRPAISCATPISPGMEIYTNTPGVKQIARRLESLLINQPLDCPICDQAANVSCKNTRGLRPEREPLLEGEVHKPKAVTSDRASARTRNAASVARCIRFTKASRRRRAGHHQFAASFIRLPTFPECLRQQYTLNTVESPSVGRSRRRIFVSDARLVLKETKAFAQAAAPAATCSSFARRRNPALHAARQRRRQPARDVIAVV